MKIKENKTRISLWIHKERFCKIESNKLIITNGYSKLNRHLWSIFNFNKIDECLELLKCYLLGRKINILLDENILIKNIYIKLFN